jgi:hypothetical protein
LIIYNLTVLALGAGTFIAITFAKFQKGLSEMASPSKSSGTSLAGSHERSFGDV